MNEEKQPKNIEETKEEIKDDIKKESIAEVHPNTTPVKSKQSLSPMAKKMIVFGGGIILLLLLIVLVLFIVRLVKGGSVSYTEIEKRMENAAREYYKVHNSLLPTNVGDEIVITVDELYQAEFLTTPLSKMIPKGVECEASVIINKSGENLYSYTPYLNCGDAYYSREFYKAILEKEKIVTSGEGLYQWGEDYVYRGDEPNNYVNFGGKRWLVIRINADKTIQMIQIGETELGVWDNRFNVEYDGNDGINTYAISRIYEKLQDMTKDNGFLSEKDRSKLVLQSLCIGKRVKEDVGQDGTVECSERLDNQLFGLLPLHQFMNGSLDESCRTAQDGSCTNYNYLANYPDNWWTITGNRVASNRVFSVTGSGVVSNNRADAEAYIRPVITLNSHAMVSGGDGSYEKPYIVK